MTLAAIISMVIFHFFVPDYKVEYGDIKVKKNVAPTTFFRKTQPGRKKSNMAVL